MKMSSIIVPIMLTLCLLSSAHAVSSKHTQTQLSELEQNMDDIQHQLTLDESSRNTLYKKLASTEKKMGEDLHALHTIKNETLEKKQAIQNLLKTIDGLSLQLKTQQLALANHVRARHRLGAIHPWQWLLHQETPRTMARLFVFYDYLFRADQELIEQVRKTSTHLSNNQTALLHKQHALQTLQKKLLQRQTRLTQMQKEQRTLIHALDQTIQSKHEQLSTFKHDKIQLQALLNKLNTRPAKHATSPEFNIEGHMLQSPLEQSSNTTKPLNQGLVFLAHEGTPVIAVLPGKVVFSDWLKGYGLLLIVDHGNGMMSLYAHNASLFTSLGTLVKQGDQIATVGHTGGLRENGLYFEIRRRGRAVPPREWMS
jgi:murein hydrolase activator